MRRVAHAHHELVGVAALAVEGARRSQHAALRVDAQRWLLVAAFSGVVQKERVDEVRVRLLVGVCGPELVDVGGAGAGGRLILGELEVVARVLEAGRVVVLVEHADGEVVRGRVATIARHYAHVHERGQLAVKRHSARADGERVGAQRTRLQPLAVVLLIVAKKRSVSSNKFRRRKCKNTNCKNAVLTR